MNSIEAIEQAIQNSAFEQAVELSTQLLASIDKNTEKNQANSVSESTILFRRGYAHFRLENFELALQDYNQAIEQAENPNIYSERGVLHFRMGNIELALEDMDTALRLEPENPYRYSSRAYIRASIGMLMLAREDYRKAIELDPEDSIAYNNLGLIEEQIGYKDRAKDYYQKADALQNKNPNKETSTNEQNLKDRPIEKEKVKPITLQTTPPTSYSEAIKTMFSSKKAFKNALCKAKEVYFGKSKS